MEKVKGTITKVSQKDGKFGIEIGQGNWYNGFGTTNVKSGDEVEIEYEVNDKWKNTTPDQVKILSKAPEVKNIDRPNVDAGNIIQRSIELLNGCQDLSFAEKEKILKGLTEEITAIFLEIKDRL